MEVMETKIDLDKKGRSIVVNQKAQFDWSTTCNYHKFMHKMTVPLTLSLTQ